MISKLSLQIKYKERPIKYRKIPGNHGKNGVYDLSSLGAKVRD